MSPGETLTVTLVWRAETSLDADHTVFLHLIDADGDLVSQDDGPPLGGAYPTSLWIAGDVVRDSHHLPVNEDSASGACTLSLGMYNPRTSERLPAYRPKAADEEDLRFQDDIIVATGITIK